MHLEDIFDRPLHINEPVGDQVGRQRRQEQAVATDQERSSPTRLGPDCPRGENYYSSFGDYDYLRAARIGDVTLDGVVM